MHDTGNENVNELEQMLAALTPAPVRIDRDQVLFRAGQAWAGGRVRLWQVATLFFALVAGGLAVGWSLRPEPRTIVVQLPPRPEKLPPPKQQAPDPAPAKTPIEEPPPAVAAPDLVPRPTLAYFKLQDDLLRRGLDGIPPLPPETETPPSPTPDLTVPRGQRSVLNAWPSFLGEF